MHDCQTGERLQVDIAPVRHRRVGEEDDRVELGRSDQCANLLVAAALTSLQPLYRDPAQLRKSSHRCPRTDQAVARQSFAMPQDPCPQVSFRLSWATTAKRRGAVEWLRAGW